MAIRVGITGNIGSGKTLVCSIFEHLNVPVFYADEEAKKLYNDDAIRTKVKNYFGSEAYFENGTLNRAFIAACAFNNKQMLELLEKTLYPVLNECFEQWFVQHKSHDYVLYEAALIFEKAFQKRFDKIILVTAPESLRIARVMERDSLNEKQIHSRMNLQWSEEKKRESVNFVIENDGINMLIPQVLSIHHRLVSLAKT